MKLKNRIPLTIIVVDVITAALLALFSYQSQTQTIEKLKSDQFHNVVNAINFVFETRSNGAASRANILANLSTVRDVVQAKDRDALYQYLAPTFQTQNKQYSIKDLQIHLPPAMLFLKFSDLKSKGEDQSSFRPLILAVSREKSTQQGIELGRHGLSIRAAAPIKDAEGGYLGSLEVDLSFTSAIQQIKTITSYEVGAFINCELLQSVSTSIPMPEPERQIGGLCNVPGDASDWDTIRAVVNPAMLRSVKDSMFIATEIDDVYYGIVLHPLIDFRGEQIGVMVAAHDMSEFHREANAALINIIVLYLLQLIIVIGALLVVFNGLLLRPLEALSQTLNAAAKNQEAEDLSDLSKRQDEIGDMSRAVDAIKKVLKKKKAGR